MKNNQKLIAIAKQVQEKSDWLIVWNTKYYPRYWRIEKAQAIAEMIKQGKDRQGGDCGGPFFQLEEKEYDPQTKRLWIYVNHPENKLLYVCEVIPTRGKLPVSNPRCGLTYCCDTADEYNQGKAKSYVSDKICKFAYEFKLLHKFDKGNGLEELRKHKHKKTGRPWKPPQSFVYVGSYPELVKDIIAGKVW